MREERVCPEVCGKGRVKVAQTCREYLEICCFSYELLWFTSPGRWLDWKVIGVGVFVRLAVRK